MNRRKLTKGLSYHAKMLLSVVVERCVDPTLQWCVPPDGQVWCELLNEHQYVDDNVATPRALEALERRGFIVGEWSKGAAIKFYRSTEDGLLAYERELRAELGAKGELKTKRAVEENEAHWYRKEDDDR